MGMPQLFRRSQGVEHDLQRLVDLTEAELRQAEQAPTVDLGVLTEHVGRSVVSLERIEFQRALEMALRFRQFALVDISVPRQPMADNACRAVRKAVRQRKKALGQRYRLRRAPARNQEGELPEQEGKDQGCRLDRQAELHAALATLGNLVRHSSLGAGKRSNESRRLSSSWPQLLLGHRARGRRVRWPRPGPIAGSHRLRHRARH
jgi:hypothetical protein